MNLTDRFMSKVKKTESCWLWTAYTNKWGYGTIKILGKMRLAHRVSFTLFRCPIPEGLLVCHTCDNPPCVNPDHLWLGTDKDNASDCLSKGRNPQAAKTHCINGHEFNEKNTNISSTTGERVCRACKRINRRRYLESK